MKITKYILITLAISLLATSCKLGPDYKRPEIVTAEKYRFTASNDSIGDTQWWTMFNDSDLDTLVKYALDSSLDVLAMAQRVEQARYNVGYVKADMWPNFGVQAKASRGNFGGFRLPSETNNFSAGVNMAWEIDFWGKYRSLNDAAKAEYLSTEFGMRTLQISVITEVIRNYFLLLDYKSRLEIAKKTLKSRDEYLKIIQQRFDVGYAPEIDLNQAQMQKAIAEGSIPVYQRLVSKTENALSVLIGKNPGEVISKDNIFSETEPETIPNGLPSELLERRPDILQAEMNLKAQNEQISAAIAMRFPSITLSGFLGGASNDLSTFTSNGAAWNMGAGLLGPLFNFNKNKRRVQIQRAKTEEALYQYRKTVLYAFKEVEDALVDIETYKEEIKSRQSHFDAANNAMQLSQQRYDKGVTSYLEVLETQRQAFESELNLSKTKQELFNSYMKLYKAIGGGWISEEEKTAE
jgi:multidrug efflux system outer membrane protein